MKARRSGSRPGPGTTAVPGLRFGSVAALSLALALAGCAGMTTSNSNPFAGGGDGSDRQILLVVENQQFNEAQITAYRSGSRNRIGRIGGNQVESFRVDWPVDGLLEVEIDVLAGQRFRTSPVSVDPGERVQLVITDPLRRSYLQR